ncbi:MAG: hypothetical protein IPP77_01285 [Bacteroidetes bacterium]|nr:hypothetical protein [Bacteroidota bacterium]
MKKTFIFFLFLSCFNCDIISQSLSNEEKKQLKKELRNYLNDIESYHALMVALQTKIDSSSVELQSLNKDLIASTLIQNEMGKKASFCDSMIMALQQENAVLKGDPSTSPKAHAKKGAVRKVVSTSSESTSVPTMGVAYKVQIGAYKQFDFSGALNEPRCINHEKANGLNRYNIGYFTDEDAAKEFMFDIRKMGIKDAFVAKYIDGKRDNNWNPSLKPMLSSTE